MIWFYFFFLWLVSLRTFLRLYFEFILISLPGPVAYYKSLVNQGKLKNDPYQEQVALELDNLLGRLDQYEKDMKEYHVRVMLNMMRFLIRSYSLLYVCLLSLHRQNLLNGKRIAKKSGGGF